MTASATTPWGHMPLKKRPGSRFTDQSRPVRRAGPCAADVSAPGEGSSRPSSGAGDISVPAAGYCVLTVTVPESVLMLLRLIGAHDGMEDEGAVISRALAARADAIGIAKLSEFMRSHEDGAHSHTLRSREGREGMPSGVFPLPQEPP